jgi:DNA-binding NtrC family response regulator
MPKILVVDDELSIRESFALILSDKYELLLAASGEAALQIVTTQKIDLAFLDIKMPGLDGLETLKRIKQLSPDLEVVMVTAVNDVRKASAAIKYGARDYVIKPFDVDFISKLTEQLLRKKALRLEGQALQKSGHRIEPALLGQHEKIRLLTERIKTLKEEQRVMIIGPIGTERELVARVIHQQSNHRQSEFKTVKLSPTQTTASLKMLFFGRGKGNSLSELTAKTGLLEAVQHGTIFIDNLQYLPDEIFKAIAAGRFSREGSTVPIKITARLIGGATDNLIEKSKALFEFFADVYLEVPSLKERASDLPLLIAYYLDYYNEQYNKDCRLTSEAAELLNNYGWPGNTVQLANLLEHLVLTATDQILRPKDLPLEMLLYSGQPLGNNLLKDFEQLYLHRALSKFGGNREQAAHFLALNPLLIAGNI